jgi:hypothetical protein
MVYILAIQAFFLDFALLGPVTRLKRFLKLKFEAHLHFRTLNIHPEFKPGEDGDLPIRPSDSEYQRYEQNKLYMLKINLLNTV